MKTLHNMLFSLHFNWISSCLFGSFVHWLCCFPFSMSPTVGCVQHSTPQNMYVAEEQPCCPLRLPLSRTSIVPCPPSLGILGCQCTWHMSSWACTYARECKLTFLSVIDMYIHTYVRTHVPTHVQCENRSFIQSLVLLHSAIIKSQNTNVSCVTN